MAKLSGVRKRPSQPYYDNLPVEERERLRREIDEARRKETERLIAEGWTLEKENLERLLRHFGRRGPKGLLKLLGLRVKCCYRSRYNAESYVLLRGILVGFTYLYDEYRVIVQPDGEVMCKLLDFECVELVDDEIKGERGQVNKVARGAKSKHSKVRKVQRRAKKKART